MAKKASKLLRQVVISTKSEQIVGLLKQSNGASITELAKATGWQDHSVCSFLSGTLKKKLGLDVVCIREGDPARKYQITSRVGAAL